MTETIEEVHLIKGAIFHLKILHFTTLTLPEWICRDQVQTTPQLISLLSNCNHFMKRISKILVFTLERKPRKNFGTSIRVNAALKIMIKNKVTSRTLVLHISRLARSLWFTQRLICWFVTRKRRKAITLTTATPNFWINLQSLSLKLLRDMPCPSIQLLSITMDSNQRSALWWLSRFKSIMDKFRN